ncbi:hypothetical protein [Leucothrix arctica]|uniref:Uncharacterized protein n=1 Tax=Leucothrix arctica TaxID=1481894 RepID=A0A317C6B5_9GAMM|nr:hypothetical protein [Leucothrix arctica]PWQ93741.1 hypothetical protein DKT75_19215 [Leucothrix arctica]
MDSFLVSNLKSLIIFGHLSGLAFGVGGAWILDLYILRKMYKYPITKENIQIIKFVSKVVSVGLVILWLSGLSFLVFYIFFQPELLLNHKIWAKLTIVIILSINGYYLHQYVIPVIVNNKNKVLINTISLKQANIITLVGCVSCITWPTAMFLGVFKSLNFSFSVTEILSFYLAALICALGAAFALKSYLVEKEMDLRIKKLNKHLLESKQRQALLQQDIKSLIKLLKPL